MIAVNANLVVVFVQKETIFVPKKKWEFYTALTCDRCAGTQNSYSYVVAEQIRSMHLWYKDRSSWHEFLHNSFL